jgi:hypothetical protein
MSDMKTEFRMLSLVLSELRRGNQIIRDMTRDGYAGLKEMTATVSCEGCDGVFQVEGRDWSLLRTGYREWRISDLSDCPRCGDTHASVAMKW